MCTYAEYARKAGRKWPLCNRPGAKFIFRPDLDPNKNYPLSFDTQCSVCTECGNDLFGSTLETDSERKIVPLSAVRPIADKWVVSLVAIRQDRHYLPKSLVFTVHKNPFLKGFRTPFTKFIIKKTQHLSEEEYQGATKSSPKDEMGGPTMGHTYVVMSLYKGSKLLADYSFGYFPSGVVNPDSDAHHLLTNEQRLRIDFKTSKEQWNAAFAVVVDWRNDHKDQDYDLFGQNCTAFSRAVITAAGLKYPGDKILAMSKNGLGKVDTPNKTYKAMMIGGMAYDPSNNTTPTAQPVQTVNSISLRNSQEFVLASLNSSFSSESSDGYTFFE